MTENLKVAQGAESFVEESPRRGGWRILESVVLLLLLGVGLYLLAPKLIGDREMLAVVRNANFLLVPVALIIEAASMLSICRLYYEVLRLGGGTLPFSRVFLIYMSAYAFGHVVPGGNAGTLYLNYRELRREDVPKGLTLKTLAVSYVIYSAALIVLLAAGLLLSLATGRLPFAYDVTALGIAGGSLLFLLSCVLVLRRRSTVRRMAGGVVRGAHRLCLLHGLSEEEAERRALEIRGYLVSVFTDRRNLLRTGFYGLGFWLMDVACLYTVFVAIGYPINPGILLVCYTVADIMGSIPLTPAGLGIFEVSLGATLYAFGYPAEVLATAILGFRFFSFWLCTFAGGSCYPLLLLARRRDGKPPRAGFTA